MRSCLQTDAIIKTQQSVGLRNPTISSCTVGAIRRFFMIKYIYNRLLIYPVLAASRLLRLSFFRANLRAIRSIFSFNYKKANKKLDFSIDGCFLQWYFICVLRKNLANERGQTRKMAVEFDYSKLRGRIRECYKTETKFADALGIAPTTLSSKLNNKVGFSNDEMLEICNLLSIPLSDTVDYFFANGAKKN